MYIFELISNFRLSGAKPPPTLLELYLKLTTVNYDKAIGADADNLLQYITTYLRIIGKPIYSTITRPHISYVVQTLSQFMLYPMRSHLEASTRVLRNL